MKIAKIKNLLSSNEVLSSGSFNINDEDININLFTTSKGGLVIEIERRFMKPMGISEYRKTTREIRGEDNKELKDILEEMGIKGHFSNFHKV